MLDDIEISTLEQMDALYNLALKTTSAEQYEGSLWNFVQDAWPFIESSKFQSGWAIEAYCAHLEAVTRGEVSRLLVNFPPRSSKTLIGSVCWPMWVWARSERSYWSGPGVKFLCASYNDDLAIQHATAARRLLMSPFYQKFWGNRFKLTWDQASKTQFDNTEGGTRRATSVRGSLLGLGGDCVIVDDPHNTETEKAVETDSDRKRVLSWWKELSGTRLNDPKNGAIVVIMQRLHQEDLSGVILESDEDWVHFMVPMHWDEGRRVHTVVLPQYDDTEKWTDPRTYDGELMWPERFGEREVKRMEDQLGIYMASGRLEQMPTPKGGGIIQSQWWLEWGTESARQYGLEWNDTNKSGRRDFPEMNLVVASVDTAFKEKEENDYNAITVWGIWNDKAGNRRAMLMYAWRGRRPLHGVSCVQEPGEPDLDFRERVKRNWGLVEMLADICKRYRVHRLLIEDKARGHDVAGEINRLYARERWGVEMYEPAGDKVSRGHTIVPLFTDGVVWAPDTRWAQMVIDECAAVPKAPNDDCYDTVTQFLHWARERGILERADEVTAALEDEAKWKPKQQSVAQQYGV